MTDPAILEAATQALAACGFYDHEARAAAHTMLNVAEPLIRNAALEEAALANGDVLQNDLRDLLDVLGMPSGAQPRSPHEVFRDALTRMKLIRAAALEEAAKVAEEYHSPRHDYPARSYEIAAAIRALKSAAPAPPDDSA